MKHNEWVIADDGKYGNFHSLHPSVSVEQNGRKGDGQKVVFRL